MNADSNRQLTGTEIVEPCEQINKINNDPDEVARSLESNRSLSTLVQDVDGCSTVAVKGLSLQIISEMNSIEANCLESCADLNLDNDKSVNPFLQPLAKAALKRAVDERGQKLLVNSAYRTLPQQLMLYNQCQNGQCGILLAAKPGTSNHERGLALDVQDYKNWRAALENHGWRWHGDSDAVHFDYEGDGTRQDISHIAIKAFQRLWNRHNPNDPIAEDGESGADTLERLNRSPRGGFGVTDGQSSTPPTTRILRLSAPRLQGDDVRKVQEALVKVKIHVTVDGIFGPGTESAVKQFQQQKGLTADGAVGPATLLELGL